MTTTHQSHNEKPTDPEIDRVRYHDGARLASRDMREDARFESRLRSVHVRALHDTWGVALGFLLAVDADGETGHHRPGIRIRPPRPGDRALIRDEYRGADPATRPRRTGPPVRSSVLVCGKRRSRARPRGRPRVWRRGSRSMGHRSGGRSRARPYRERSRRSETAYCWGRRSRWGASYLRSMGPYPVPTRAFGEQPTPFCGRTSPSTSRTPEGWRGSQRRMACPGRWTRRPAPSAHRPSTSLASPRIHGRATRAWSGRSFRSRPEDGLLRVAVALRPPDPER